MDLGMNAAGSLTLKSNFPMEYSRGVLSNKWYLKRESEPKDAPLWSGTRPSLQQSTYKILGKSLADDVMLTDTETRSRQQEVFRLIDEGKDVDFLTKQMVDMKNKDRLNDRIDSYNNIKDSLPSHKEGHNKFHLETTYNKDYTSPFPELQFQKSEKMIKTEFEKTVDNSFGYRKMVSQFSDIDSPKRAGINTFHVQHGLYPNQVIRKQLNDQRDNNIFDREYK